MRLCVRSIEHQFMKANRLVVYLISAGDGGLY